MDEATAAAAAEIQVNNELHELHCQVDNDATNETDSDLESEEDEQESDDEQPEPEAVLTGDLGADQLYPGIMSTEDVSSLSKSDHRKYTRAMNKVIATAGSGKYEFQSPDRVRCLICAEAHPKTADRAKGRGGSQVGGEAIIRLRRPYDVHKIVNQKIGSKKSQIGHHHVVHGSMQSQAKKNKSKGVDELAAWKTVFGLQRHPALDENSSLPPIHHIVSMKKAAETVQDEQRGARAAKMLQLWEVRAAKAIDEARARISEMTEVQQIGGEVKIVEMQWLRKEHKKLPSLAQVASAVTLY